MENKLNQAAIESYSVKITKKLSDDFFQKNLVISGSQILNYTPIEQINLFVISNLFDKWKEETSKLKSPYFDFEHAEVNGALKTFMNVLSKHISIRRSDFDPLFRNAVANALCLTLAPYLFLKENYFSFETPIIQMNEFKERVKFLRINKTITDTFIRKIEKHNLSSTPLSYALDYLNESYKEVASEMHDAAEIIAEINKLEPVTLEQLVFMFKPSPKIEIPIIEIPAPVLKHEPLQEEYQSQAAPLIDESIGSNAVANIEEVTDTPVAENIVEKPVYEPLRYEAPAVEEEEMPELEIAAPEVQKEVTEVIMEIVITEPDKVELVESTVLESVEDNTKEEKASLNDLLKSSAKKLTVLEHANQNKGIDLKSMITINQKFMFVNELFKGESKVFQETLEKIGTCNSYNEAINMLLDNYANRYDWDTDKEEVAEFFELISRLFVTE
jgi:hypothetical protein